MVCGGTCHLGETERKTREREQNKSTPFSLLSSLFSLGSLPCSGCNNGESTPQSLLIEASVSLRRWYERSLFSPLSVGVISLSRRSPLRYRIEPLTYRIKVWHTESTAHISNRDQSREPLSTSISPPIWTNSWFDPSLCLFDCQRGISHSSVRVFRFDCM